MDIDSQDEKRLSEIATFFDTAGRKLFVSDQDGSWEAMFPIKHYASFAPAAYGSTPVAAAEAAWLMYRSEPHLGGVASQPTG